MEKSDFYARIQKVIKRELTDAEVKDLERSVGRDERKYEFYKSIGKFEEYRTDFIEFYDIADVPSRIRLGSIGYWIYDRTTRTLICNFQKSHEHLIATLYNIYTGRDFWPEDAAEFYIEKGMGCYTSAVMNSYIPIKHPSMDFDAEELILDQAKGRLQWRNIKQC